MIIDSLRQEPFNQQFSLAGSEQQMLKKKETLVLVVSRRTVAPQVIPALKLIIPMLELVGPLEVISSDNIKLQKPIYENLVRYLTKEGTVYPLEFIIEELLAEKGNRRFRICVLGEEDVSWKLILACKRKQVVVDVAGKNSYLPFWTGGIHRPVSDRDVLAAFVQDFAVDTDLRKIVTTSKSKSIEFAVNCICCDRRITEAYLCSSCLAIYCADKRRSEQVCRVCGERFDSPP